MDTLRGFSDDRVGLEIHPFDMGEDEVIIESPPPAVGQDERRMQVRAYNFWAGLLGDRRYPLAAALTEADRPDFSEHAVLLHFDDGMEDPSIAFLGANLAAECETPATLRRLSDVPGRSLLSRITDHYMQIIANEAPIGFEAEFVNFRDRTILYRGILLPFSSDGATIDYIYGVINWKELADQQMTDELLLEIGQVLDADRAKIGKEERKPVTLSAEWADGPVALELGEIATEILPMPAPAFGMPEVRSTDGAEEAWPIADADPATPFDGDAVPHALADWLASARDLAHAALSSEDRSRSTLYAAIGRAWDFALAAQAEPRQFAELIAESGMTVQERAPLTPIVKLVFGAEYDKTRVTEYATVLAHAQRIGLGHGELGAFLSQATGGLKGVVNAERALRRADSGKTRRKPATTAETLRTLPARSLADISAEGAEFALVVVRRMETGELAFIGEISDDETLLERAARKFVD